MAPPITVPLYVIGTQVVDENGFPATDSNGEPFPPIPVEDPTIRRRRLHWFRQSSLKTLDNCMELARLEMSGLIPRTESDAASMGTGVHLAIETSLLDVLRFGYEPPLEVAQQVAQDCFSDLVATEGFRWIQVKEGGARAFIDRAVAKFYDELLPTLRPLHMEMSFGPLVLHEDDERIIVVTGTVDYVDELLGLCDWKTANRKYERWEHARWDVQPSVYTWAAHELGIVDFDDDATIPFTFFVFLKKQDVEIQKVQVTRHEGDWRWLKKRAVTVAKLIEADLDEWPLNDTGWHCSSKWCGNWDNCKGATRGPGDDY